MTAPLHLYLVLGLPGSGKSTFVSHALGDTTLFYEYSGILPANTQRICFDTIRKALGHEYCRATEPQVNAIACTLVRMAFLEGRSAIVDESITERLVAEQLYPIAREFKATVDIFRIATPETECRANRIPFGFPEGEFNRKVEEWKYNSEWMLAHADTITTLFPAVSYSHDGPVFLPKPNF